MARSIKGLAKVDIKEEVRFITEGLRSKVPSQVQVSAAHLKGGLADVVGSQLLPFVGTLGGELVMCCKKCNVPEVWEAAAALVLAVGASSAKSLCEPLLEHMSHVRELSSEAIQAARTFIAVCGRHISSPIRTAIEYTALRELYHAVVYSSTESTTVDDAIDLLATSLTAPYLFNSNPIIPHAVYALRKAAASSRLTVYTRTTALSVLRCLDGQVHTQAAALVVPKLDEIESQLKRLQGLDADAELAFFNSLPEEPIEQAQPSAAHSLDTPTPTPAESAVKETTQGADVATPPPVFRPAALLMPENTQGSEQFFSPVSTIGGSPLEAFGSRKRSASPDEEPVAKKPSTLPPLFASTETSLLQPVILDSQEPEEAEANPKENPEIQEPEVQEEPAEEGDSDGDSMSSISASIDLPDVDL
eukprot:TRINITY_DN9959_c0_g1_i1.p1 TRINITY_DN9959_c0_g1~~TRINITY_DN9959_c0_g1_i1.p1  ORF type:complete len:434 (+),score=119.36 TRINITY_DN9959_c0_g1_i1:51-1304(+)